MLGQEYGFEWVKENIKHCPISNSMDLLGKKFGPDPSQHDGLQAETL